MELDGTFPGRDLDEILNNMQGVEGLDDKVQYIQENFSMDEMKKLEDEGSELAEEAMIQTARENASEEQAEKFIRNGFNSSWRENPQQGLATLEKAVERHPDEPDILANKSFRNNDKTEIFQELLKNGHVRTAKQFSELVNGVRQTDLERENLERGEELDAEDLAEEVYQELEDDHYGKSAEYLEKMVEIAETFEINNWRTGNRKQDVVEKYAQQDEYKKALRRAASFGVQSLGDERDVQDVAQEGYSERMEDGKYVEAAQIAKQAKRLSENEHTSENYLEKEREAAKEAFKENVDQGDYRQAKRAISRFETEGNEEEMQTYLIKKLTNDEIDQEQYQELTEEIGYEPEENKISEEPEVSERPDPEPEPEYQEDTIEEEDEGYLSRINPFS